MDTVLGDYSLFQSYQKVEEMVEDKEVKGRGSKAKADYREAPVTKKDAKRPRRRKQRSDKGKKQGKRK